MNSCLLQESLYKALHIILWNEKNECSDLMMSIIITQDK